LELATTPTRTRLLNCLPPSSTISVLHNKEFITSNLRRLISHHSHHAPLREKILRDYKWTEQQFNSIHWEAYYKALQKHPRSHRISITKLSYSLWNTNKQNHRYYGEMALCPSCKLVTEDTVHVFSCQQPDVKAARHAALLILQQAMKRTTPCNVHEAIFSGINQWVSNPQLTTYLAPTSGSLLPQLQSITRAFLDQSSIGWDGLFRGQIAASWAEAYVKNYEAPSTKKQPSPSIVVNLSQQWSVKLILQLWEFSKTVWKYRNSVVHGKTEHSKLSKEILTMQAAVRSHYAAYRENQHYIPHNRTSLFINNTKITQFFLQRPIKSTIRPEQGILRAPFSAAYYRRTTIKTGQYGRTAPKRFPLLNRLKQQSNGDSGRTHPETTLFHHGLFTRPGHNHTILSPNRSQRDVEAEKAEYSGTFVSTVP